MLISSFVHNDPKLIITQMFINTKRGQTYQMEYNLVKKHYYYTDNVNDSY